ncbi:radical SAM protein [Thalassospiraceae bacterium LMO-JJ14]|nr:radical SAM protein [Thalassospiraceae bacterium LMO-JJ14]
MASFPSTTEPQENTWVSVKRQQTRELDSLPIIDRSLIDYSRYHQFIGHAGVKYSMAVQATRGCPYRCFYCDIYKTTEFHFRRSDENLIDEIKVLADLGVKRVEFIDDIFNVNSKQFIRFFEFVIKNNLDMKFFFPTGLKGDLLTKDMIDLMVEGGSVGVNLSLEHAAPRMQEVMRKNLNVDVLHENLTYIAKNYPQVIITLNAMHGFPTETEDEANMTLDFIKSINWIDFPYLHNVRIFPGTELEHFALEVGVPREIIEASQDMSYHEIAPTLPFSREFTSGIRTKFVRDYVLNKDRLKSVIPRQLEQFSVEELDQKYNSYFPTKRITSLADVLKLAGLKWEDVKPAKQFDEADVAIPNIYSDCKEKFSAPKNHKPEIDLLLIDMSSYFSDDFDNREYNVLEPPLGLMALQSYVDRALEGRVSAKLTKSRIDFDSFEELVAMIRERNPDLIGFRAMTFYKGFFHDAIKAIRDAGIDTPIIAGGPYPTASYEEVLANDGVTMVAIGEGEQTLVDVLQIMLENGNELPDQEQLKTLPGIAFKMDMIPGTAARGQEQMHALT